MSSRREQVLLIDPPNEISFTGDFTVRVCKTKLQLSNPTDMKIAYKVKTTAPRRYCVRPNSGQINPGETAEVNIMLQPSQNNDDLQKHKFMVQSIELATQEQLDRAVDDLFKDTPSGQVMSKKLYCQFNNVADDGGENNGVYQAEETQEMENEEHAGEVPLTRPEIKSGVPTEPELIHQEPVPAAQVKENSPTEASTQPSQAPTIIEKVVETSKLTPVKPSNQQQPISSEQAKPAVKASTSSVISSSDESLKKKNQLLQRDVVNLTSQLKSMRDKLNSASAQSTVATPLQGEDPQTVKKVMIILFIIAFIVGWMVSSFFCKSCEK